MHELYTICGGKKVPMLRSDDPQQIRESYAMLKAGHAHVRVSIGGKQLTIHEADEWCGNDLLNRAVHFQIVKNNKEQ